MSYGHAWDYPEHRRARITLRGLARDKYQGTTGSRRFRQQANETTCIWLRRQGKVVRLWVRDIVTYRRVVIPMYSIKNGSLGMSRGHHKGCHPRGHGSDSAPVQLVHEVPPAWPQERANTRAASARGATRTASVRGCSRTANAWGYHPRGCRVGLPATATRAARTTLSVRRLIAFSNPKNP
ncbi:hypothetical protein PanWU01x14_332910 [Parasponia andersonii]|uniref:Uncharacterized protein n=1 Tax=Parasponia andersonii TaxID=3476 RepID=A0A2P5AH31_PARAD|nr:hypothetical protein PanWU01x14_332910 [Parasponia andersonii]